MEGLQLKGRVMVVQRGKVWAPQAGNPPPPPAPSYLAGPSAVPLAGNEEDPIFNIEHQIPGKQATFETTHMQEKCSGANNAVFVRVPLEDNSTMVVDMGAKTAPVPVENVIHIPSGAQQLEQGSNIIKWRKPIMVKEDPTDVQYIPTEIKRGGIVKSGDFKDVYQMCKEQSAQMEKGVICNTKVLHNGVNGDYNENEQYTVNPAKFKGGYGECSMCQDITTGKTFMRKTVKGEWKNEVLIPLLLGGLPGIPEVYGIIQREQTVQIFQKFAGDSLMKLRQPDSGYADRVSDPSMVLGLAFQGFRTVDRLHSRGVQHLDIKPENLCVDMGAKSPSMHLIDFGSCQTRGEVTTQGVTFEYMSPESAVTFIKNQQVPSEQQRPLEAGTDVWAMALSLMYCLRGFHVMVHAFTNDTVYHGTVGEREMQRVNSLLRVIKLTDADIAKLIDPAWPAVLRELFTNTLRVNKEQRWSAKKAADFLVAHILQGQISGSVGQPGRPAPPSGSAERPSPSTSSTVGCPGPPSGFIGRPAPANSSAAVASVIRLRVPVAQIVPGENRLCPWNVAASPGSQLRQVGRPTPHVLTRIQPGKRKLEEDEVPVQLCKIIRK